MAKTSSGSSKSGGSTPSKSGGSAGGKELSKAQSSAKSDGGFMSSVRDFFSGGSRSSSGPTANNPPRARPGVLDVGTGKDKVYIDTKTGARYAEPEYSSFSFRGLTSNDPANVARNRAGAQRMAALDAERAAYRNDKDSGILSALAEKPAENTPKFTPDQLAALGVSNSPVSPVEVATPNYGLPSLQPTTGDGVSPMLNYGAAFQPMPGQAYNPLTYMNLADIFDTFPSFGMRQ